MYSSEDEERKFIGCTKCYCRTSAYSEDYKGYYGLAEHWNTRPVLPDETALKQLAFDWWATLTERQQLEYCRQPMSIAVAFAAEVLKGLGSE